VVVLLHLLTGFIHVPGGAAMITVTIALAMFAAVLVQHAQLAVRAGSRLAAVHGTAAWEQSRATAFLPQRDPDAAGRSRPRAPGRSYPAA
jgi:Family of unknown function (DUF6412)